MNTALRLMGALAVVMLLAGCGKEEAPVAGAKPGAGRKAVPLTEAQQAAIKLTAGMVSAVPSDEKPAATAVKFDLLARPELNQPLKIKLVFVPARDAAAVTATFVADRGLTIPPGQPAAQFDAVQAGAAYPYELTVVPNLSGVQAFSTLVQVTGEGEPQVQTFAVPIVVGPPPGR